MENILEQLRLNSEQFEQIKEFFEKAMDAARRVWENIKKFAKQILKAISKAPGYKRLSRRIQLAYYESISSGKSNNWRKMHGLNLIRRQGGVVDID